MDTQALLWFRLGDPKLGPNARREAENALRAGQLAVSVVSFWEVGWLLAKKRIDLKLDIERWRAELLADGLVEIPLTGEMAVRAAKLPNLHPDPADRFIVAAALDGHRLLAADRRSASGCRHIRGETGRIGSSVWPGSSLTLRLSSEEAGGHAPVSASPRETT